jgi:hypothetical protein
MAVKEPAALVFTWFIGIVGSVETGSWYPVFFFGFGITGTVLWLSAGITAPRDGWKIVAYILWLIPLGLLVGYTIWYSLTPGEFFSALVVVGIVCSAVAGYVWGFGWLISGRKRHAQVHSVHVSRITIWGETDAPQLSAREKKRLKADKWDDLG